MTCHRDKIPGLKGRQSDDANALWSRYKEKKKTMHQNGVHDVHPHTD